MRVRSAGAAGGAALQLGPHALLPPVRWVPLFPASLGEGDQAATPLFFKLLF